MIVYIHFTSPMPSKKSNPTSHTPESIQKLADTGTKEAIIELEHCMEHTADPDKCAYAREHYNRCLELYYAPKNEAEDTQWAITKLLYHHRMILSDLSFDQDELQTMLEEITLETQINEAVCAKHPTKAKKWAHFSLTDVLKNIQDDHQEVLDEIEFETAWVAQAESMITVERYQNIPIEHLSVFEPFDDESDIEDEDECFCDECMSEYAEEYSL